MNETVPLDADTTVRFAEFFPDYAVQDGQVYRKSNELENPAAHLVVTSKSAGKDFDVWFPEIEGVADNSKAPYQFRATDLKMGHFTGLQVSHEPGQWGVWSGVVLMVRWTGICVLPSPYAVLGGTGLRPQDGQALAVDRGQCEP